MRLFVAFELPTEVQTRIVERVAPLRAELPPASWVPAERMHLTLVFLGEVEPARLEALGQALRPLFAGTPILRLRLDSAGAFPPGSRARVAWIGVGASVDGALENELHAESGRSNEVLAAVERRTRAALAPLLDRPLEERPYHAHVSVARPRGTWNRGAVSAFRSACDDLRGEWRAERAVLMESRLGQQAQYSVCQQYPLGGQGWPRDRSRVRATGVACA